jgi:hypothetical protein
MLFLSLLFKLVIIIIIISLIMAPLLGHRTSLWITHKEKGSQSTTRASVQIGGCFLLKHGGDPINFCSVETVVFHLYA